jgi:DNA adenine methylase
MTACFGGANVPVDLYVEPFLGGGATFLAAVEMRAARQYVGADANTELINAWSEVRDASARVEANVRDVATRYEQPRSADREAFFLGVRDGSVKCDPVARTIFLNRTCYNGLYRVNSKGEFNSPFGDNDRKRKPGFDVTFGAIAEIGTGLQGRNVRFITWGFADVIRRATERAREGERVVIYCDPPYGAIRSPDHGFVGYTAEGFGQSEQTALLFLLRDAVTAGVRVVVTNGAYEGNASAYRSIGLSVAELDELRSINSDGEGRGGVTCLLCYGGGKTT